VDEEIHREGDEHRRDRGGFGSVLPERTDEIGATGRGDDPADPDPQQYREELRWGDHRGDRDDSDDHCREPRDPQRPLADPVALGIATRPGDVGLPVEVVRENLAHRDDDPIRGRDDRTQDRDPQKGRDDRREILNEQRRDHGVGVLELDVLGGGENPPEEHEGQSDTDNRRNREEFFHILVALDRKELVAEVGLGSETDVSDEKQEYYPPVREGRVARAGVDVPLHARFERGVDRANSSFEPPAGREHDDDE